jgi:Replication-relaxation
MTVSRHRRGPGAERLLDLARTLSGRDHAVLDEVAEHRFLTTDQIARLLFHALPTLRARLRATRRVCGRLATEELLERLPRRVGGVSAGADATVWMLTSIGHRLRSLLRGRGDVDRAREPSARFLFHCLAVAEARLAAVEAARSGALELVRLQIEPRCWRDFPGNGGVRETLRPDLALVSASGEFEDHWFVEVDLATEHLPTVVRKCQQYERYRATGREQEEHGVFPVVVWLVPDERRAAKVREAIRAARRLDQELYRVVVASDFAAVLAGGAA